jgi:hypothetical protein
LRVDRSFDRARDPVDRARKLLNPFRGLVGVPASEVGDTLATCVEADAPADDVRDALDDQLGLGAAVVLVVDAVGVREFVDESCDLAVRRELAVDHDPRFAGRAVTRRTVELLILHAVAERGGMLLELADEVGVAVAGDGLARWFEGCRLDSGERIGLGDIENCGEPKADELRFALLGVDLLGVALPVADWGEDPDRFLSLADAPAELEPLAEPGDMGRVRALERDQKGVTERYLGSS